MATRFRLNKKAFGVVVLQSEGMKRTMKHFAEPVKTRAEGTAPVNIGDYKSSFFIDTSVRTVPPYKTKRAVATVGNRSSHALHVEYGGGRQFGGGRSPRFRTLGKALGIR